MAEYGVLNTGFVYPRLNEVVSDKRDTAVRLFQDQVKPGDVVDTSDSSILGRLIALDSPSEADLWELGQQIYDAFNPYAATGFALDNLVALSGLERSKATFSTSQAIFTGNNGTLIPAGQTVGSTTSNNDFQNRVSVALNPSSATGVGVSPNVVSANTEYRINYASSASTSSIVYNSDINPTATDILQGLQTSITQSHPLLTSEIVNGILYIRFKDEVSSRSWTSSDNVGINKVSVISQLIAVNSGPISQEAGTLINIKTPILGWDGVYNQLAAVEGSNIETDTELRERFRESKYIRASNILEALYSALISLSSIEEVQIYENDTDLTNEMGIPPHSFLPIILGGIDSEIAQTIWTRKPLGIASVGNTNSTIYDSQGFPHRIAFQRPAPVDIYITINLSTNSNYPEGGDESIKQALIQYFKNNFGIGDDIVYSRLYTPINSIPGHQVNSLLIGTDLALLGANNIVIGFDEIANLQSNNIVINKT